MVDLISIVAANDSHVKTLDLNPALQGSRLYEAGVLPVPPWWNPKVKTQIEVTSERTHEAIKRLCGNNRLAHVCALNFASAKHPGGGYRRGTRAQEEDLCRVSTLHYVLDQLPDYYRINRECGSNLYTDTAIYTPGIEFFRDSYYNLIEPTYKAAIITIPAPKLVEDDEDLDPAEVHPTLVRRIRRILTIAQAHGHRTLVLGAWGCGVFRNNPADVASIFKAELEARPGAFEQVVFAIYGGGLNYDVFNRVFQKES